MIRPVSKLDTYKYFISDISLSAPDFEEPINIKATQVVSVSVIRNYENNIVPLMLLSLHVNKTDYEKVVISMKTLTATFTIYKTKEDNEQNKLQYNIPCIQGTFKTVNKDLIDTRIPNQLSNTLDSTANSTQHTLEVNLYLYDYQAILKYKKNFSYILKCTTNDVLFTMLKDRGFTNILMSPSNPNTTDDFIVPYGNLGDNLSFVDEYYGIYDAPRIFFKDFDVTYLLDKGTMGTILRKDELPTVLMYLEKSEDQSSAYNGCYVDNENGTYILNTSPFSINDTDSLADFYSAGKLISLVSGTNEKYEDIIGDYEIEKAVIINNNKSHSQMMFNINNGKRSMNIEFSDIDIDIVTPNKKYTLIPDSFYDLNYELKGDYRLSNSLLIFSRQAENMMKSVIQCSFSKL